MQITFNPALSEINRISIYDTPVLLNFTATLSVADYQELRKNGGRVQLWSDIPSKREPALYSEWTSCDFGSSAAASREDSLSLVDNDDLSSPGDAVLTLQILVPISGGDQRRFSYTYRILYPSGEIRWLGEFGLNGVLVCEHTTTEIALGLAAGWTRKEGIYMWTDRSTLTDTPVLRLVKPGEYLALTVGRQNGAFLAFLIARNNKRSVSVPTEYILCASPARAIHVQPDKTITVTGDGPLVMRSLPRGQSDLCLLKNMILDYCSSERVGVTLIGECMLVSTRGVLPVEGIIMTTPNLTPTTTLFSIPTNTLRSLLPSQTTSAPFLLFAPHTFRAHLITDVNTVAITGRGPFVLSPAFNITSKAYLSILSPHKSANLVSTANNLPTPPPSPECMPRSTIPDHRSCETVSSTPEIVAVEEAEGEVQGEDGGNTNDEIVISLPRLFLRAVTLRARYLVSVALFGLTLVYKLIFGKSTAEEEEVTVEQAAELQEDAAGAHDHQPKALAVERSSAGTVAADVRGVALDQKDIANDSDIDSARGGVNINVSERGAYDNARTSDDGVAGIAVATGSCMPKNPGPELEMLRSSPRVLLVEVGGRGTVRVAVCEGEPCGVVNAEMNGKRVFVGRMDDSAQALVGARVEFWELAVEAGGMLRISYDQDKTLAC